MGLLRVVLAGEGADPPSQEMEAMEEDAKASEPV